MPPINHHSCNTEILDFWKTWICSQHVRSFLEQQKWTTSTDPYRSQMASLLLNSCPPFQRATTRAQMKLHIKNLCKWFILPTIQPSLRNKKIFLQIWFEDSIHMPFEKLSQTLGGTTTPWPGNLAKSVLFQSIPNQAGYHLPVMRNKPNRPVTRKNTPSPKWGNL